MRNNNDDSTQQLKKTHLDSYKSCDIHIPKYNITIDLPHHLNASFWEWFERESILYNKKQVKWANLDDDNKIKRDPGMCHYNSLFNSITCGYELYSGLVIQDNNTGKKSYVIHSFNVKKKIVFDFTYFYNQKKDSFTLASFPFEYIGVNISKKFIDKIEYLLKKKKSKNPLKSYVINYSLSIPYFLYLNTKSEWKDIILNKIELISTH
jgi:hypothetical protein